jgi:hypothetical protein
LLACSKEMSQESGSSTGNNNNNNYYISFKVDGTTKSYDQNTMAVIMDMAGTKSLSLVAQSSASTTNLEGINLTINFTTGGPATGTFAEDNTGTDYVVGGVYNTNSTAVVYAAGLVSPSVKPLTINITHIDEKEITGTFSGAFYKQDVIVGQSYDNEYFTLTDGTFKLPVK